MVEVKEWSFSKDGTGGFSSNGNYKNRICAEKMSFSYRIQGESIFITPIERKSGCKEKRSEDDEVILEKEKEKIQPYSISIKPEAADKLSVGGSVFTKY